MAAKRADYFAAGHAGEMLGRGPLARTVVPLPPASRRRRLSRWPAPADRFTG